jgi:Tat protein secretion system quality control protein TatD with DNase activity
MKFISMYNYVLSGLDKIKREELTLLTQCSLCSRIRKLCRWVRHARQVIKLVFIHKNSMEADTEHIICNLYHFKHVGLIHSYEHYQLSNSFTGRIFEGEYNGNPCFQPSDGQFDNGC